ncbi:MAG: hypothetical protein M0Z61_07480 [Nitrospiraceae bacterium]|nr:hypothetical protein [Nitrospiraceae bacterium]
MLELPELPDVVELPPELPVAPVELFAVVVDDVPVLADGQLPDVLPAVLDKLPDVPDGEVWFVFEPDV